MKKILTKNLPRNRQDAKAFTLPNGPRLKNTLWYVKAVYKKR